MKRKHLDGETGKSKRPEGAAKLKAKKSKVHESVQGAETETVKSPELEGKKRGKLSEKRSSTSKKKASKQSIEGEATQTDKPRKTKLKKVKTTAPAVQEDTEVDGEQQRRALQREIQQLVMRLFDRDSI